MLFFQAYARLDTIYHMSRIVDSVAYNYVSKRRLTPSTFVLIETGVNCVYAIADCRVLLEPGTECAYYWSSVGLVVPHIQASHLESKESRLGIARNVSSEAMHSCKAGRKGSVFARDTFLARPTPVSNMSA
jgi:hypothetical protein